MLQTMADGSRRGRTGGRILDAALELFNRDGTGRVTTNHIAAHLQISPGNLYYWFPDKQAIVRALWARYAAQQAALWDSAGDDLPDPREMVARLAALTGLTRSYLFLARDGLALAQEDPQLRTAFVRARERTLAIFGALARTWRADGLIRPVDDQRLDALVTALWTLAETALPFTDLHDGVAAAAPGTDRAPADPTGAEAARAAVADADAARVAALLTAVLEPYLPG